MTSGSDGFRKSRLHQPGDAGQPFAAAARFIAGEIVDPGAGMGVDDAERRRLFLQIGQNAHQHDVLDDVGKAAGVKGVTVIHGEEYATTLRRAQAFYVSRAGRSRRSATVDRVRLTPMPGRHVASDGLAQHPGMACSSAAHRRHQHLVAPAAAAVDFLAGAELQVLAHADPHLAEPRSGRRSQRSPRCSGPD